jgi:hypothetical protein
MKRFLNLVLVTVAISLVGCGQEVYGGSVCDATTCAGCCDDQGKCQAGTVTTACGGGGMLCVTCPGTQTCGGGVCKDSPREVRCGSSSCRGCCDSAGTCLAGSIASACGTAGSTCVACPGLQVCTSGVCGGCSGFSRGSTCAKNSDCCSGSCTGTFQGLTCS